MNENAVTLEEALDSLDPAIDAHWTKDGLPHLDAVKAFTGKQYKRSDAEEARPGLTRETATVPAVPLLPVIGKVPAGPIEQHDFVSVLDACQAAMTENIRIYGEALYRVMQYYKAERETIVRQLENATARNKIEIGGPVLPRSAMQVDGEEPAFTERPAA